jgi:hypothetical protein
MANLIPYLKKEGKHVRQSQRSLTSNPSSSGGGVIRMKCPITELFGQKVEFRNAMTSQCSHDCELTIHTYRP